MVDHKDSFNIGYITKTRGLKGEVQLFFLYENPEELELDVVFLEIYDKLVPFFVSSYQLLSNNTGYFFFEDIDHIDKAIEIVKKNVFLPNTKKPDRDPDEFLITDLKGFTVHEKAYGELGEILEVNEFPQQFIATVSYQSKEIMFPLNDNFIIEIDKEAKVLRVDLPEGLLDIYLES
jgi:16S rRNA processing protein RimM